MVRKALFIFSPVIYGTVTKETMPQCVSYFPMTQETIMVLNISLKAQIAHYHKTQPLAHLFCIIRLMMVEVVILLPLLMR